MNKIARFGLIFVGCIAVVAVAVLIAVKVYVTPERVKAIIVPLAEKQLNRQVSLGDVSIGLLSGGELKDFKISTKDGKGNFISTDGLVFKYQLMPLLSGQVHIDEVRLVNPRIRIVRLEDGSFNFSDLLSAREATTAPAQKEEQGTDETNTQLNLALAAIDNGEVEFIDRQINRKAPYRLVIKQVTAQVKDLSLHQPFPFEMGASIKEGTFKTGGTVDLSDLSFDISADIQGLDTLTFLPYFRASLPGRLDGLHLGFDLAAKGNPRQMTAQGGVTVRDLNFTPKTMPDDPITVQQSRLDFDTALDLAADTLTVNSAKLDYPPVNVTVKGMIRQLTTKPVLALDATLPQTAIVDLLTLLPAATAKTATQFKPEGQIGLVLNLAGPVSQPANLLNGGRLTLANVQGEVAGYAPILNGQFDLAQGRAFTNELQVDLNGQKVNAAVDFKNVMQMPLVGTVALTAERINVDALLPEAETSTKKKKTADKKNKSQELGPYAIPASIEGTVRVGEVLYHKIPMRQVAVDFSLKKNILTVDPLTAQLAGGSIAGKARVNLGIKGLKYSSDLKVNQIAVEQVIPGFWPKLAGAIVGKISLAANANGRGTAMEQLKKNLQGEGALQLFGGQLSTTGLTEGLAQFTGAEELKKMSFDAIDLNFLIDKGKVRLKGRADGKEASFEPDGVVGLGGDLDMDMGMQLSPEMAEKTNLGGKIGEFLQNDKGETTIPLNVAGTITQPTFSVDPDFVQQQVKGKAKKKIKKLLNDKVLERLAPKGQGEGESTDSGKKVLDDALNNLFGN